MAVSIDDARMSAPKPVARKKGGAHLAEKDKELLQAKRLGRLVIFLMSSEMPGFTNEDGIISGTVLYVDRYDIKIELSSGRKLWLSKPHIMCTEILE